jgi:peptide chain release factor 1
MSNDELKIELGQKVAQLEDALEDATRNPKALARLGRDYARVKTVLEAVIALDDVAKQIREVDLLIQTETDGAMRQLAEDDRVALSRKQRDLEGVIEEYRFPRDPMGERDIIVEIRGGTGGDEAANFARDLFRMYERYAESRDWKTHLASMSQTDIGGMKEVIFEINGTGAYQALKFESGVHRVQRIPDTEKSGRVHTSTATVAILPKVDEVDVALDPNELKIEATTSTGAGGQSVNTTYSAIRITHLPTGLMVYCQDERSQKQNKEKALNIMRARIWERAEEERMKSERDSRRAQIGGALRSEKIRTYNIPQDRITDHRLKQNFHGITEILDGALDPIIAALDAHDKATRNDNTA